VDVALAARATRQQHPYCQHRALTLAADGRRERVVKVQTAGPASFAIGRFEIVEETLDGSPLPPSSQTSPAAAATPAPRADRARLLPGCNCFVRDTETRCPFCHGDLAALHAEHDAWREHIANTS
jgi:hypothetical protein